MEQPKRELSYHWKGGRRISEQGYVLIYIPEHPRSVGGYVYEHLLVVEAAIGKHLPVGHPIHHHNKKKTDNVNRNLVVCEDGTYHKLIHGRMDCIADGADPDVEFRCLACREIKPLKSFFRHKTRWNGRYSRCAACVNAYLREHRLQVGFVKKRRGPNKKVYGSEL